MHYKLFDFKICDRTTKEVFGIAKQHAIYLDSSDEWNELQNIIGSSTFKFSQQNVMTVKGEQLYNFLHLRNLSIPTVTPLPLDWNKIYYNSAFSTFNLQNIDQILFNAPMTEATNSYYYNFGLLQNDNNVYYTEYTRAEYYKPALAQYKYNPPNLATPPKGASFGSGSSGNNSDDRTYIDMYIPIVYNNNVYSLHIYGHWNYSNYTQVQAPMVQQTGWNTFYVGNTFPSVDDDPTDNDPYKPVGNSTTGGGDGTFDGTSDPVPVPNLPSVGAQDSGFITLFAPTAQQMKDLAHYMWVNPVFDLSAFKKLFADPMDCILGLSVVPVSVPSGGAKNVNIGNLVTSVTMNVASQQYIEVDCGTVDMSLRFFGSYLDFEPYTKISIFLPYCGTHQLNADDIIGKTIGVVYHIDILTGSCIAFVKCGDSVLYEFNGACGSNIPVNSLNFASTIENAIRIAVNIGTTVATAGAAAPATTATELARQKAMNTARNISLAGSTAEGALSMKPNVSRSGALGGGVGILGHQIPYLIITRPRLCKPANQDFFEGYPSFIQTTIGDLIGKGFTSFTDVIIASQYLTDSEESELEEILQGGVYL